MHNPTPTFSPKHLLVLAGFTVCQSAWAQSVHVSEALSNYVPVQDQLCNYCQDYSLPAEEGAIVLTRYQPGIGYPELFGRSTGTLAEADVGGEAPSVVQATSANLLK